MYAHSFLLHGRVMCKQSK